MAKNRNRRPDSDMPVNKNKPDPEQTTDQSQPESAPAEGRHPTGEMRAGDDGGAVQAGSEKPSDRDTKEAETPTSEAETPSPGSGSPSQPPQSPIKSAQIDSSLHITAPYKPVAALLQNPIVKRASAIAYANPPTTATTLGLCLDAIETNIRGCFVECGVAAGAQIACMGEATRMRNAGRIVHAFDSFAGIPEAGPKDDETITGLIGRPEGEPQLRTTGKVVHPLPEVQRNLSGMGLGNALFRFHPGWFQHTVPQAAKSIGQIAVLRLDGDLYESTKVCLEHLHGLVPLGGYVIVDDFALTGCRTACEEFFHAHGLDYNIVPIAGGDGPVFWRKLPRT